MLAGIGADPAHIRPACKLRPGTSLFVVPMIPPELALDFIVGRASHVPSEERFGAAMFIDLRGSTRLAESRAPFDSVFLLGRFIDAAARAVLLCNGRPIQIQGDGLLALFGLHESPADACQNALLALAALKHGLHDVKILFRQEAQQDLHYGVGLHCGPVIVGEIGFDDHVAFTALGTVVNIAHRLQELARDFGAVAVVSDAVYQVAGQATPCWPPASVRFVDAGMSWRCGSSAPPVRSKPCPRTRHRYAGPP